jgi:hypothetical protein
MLDRRYRATLRIISNGHDRLTGQEKAISAGVPLVEINTHAALRFVGELTFAFGSGSAICRAVRR